MLENSCMSRPGWLQSYVIANAVLAAGCFFLVFGHYTVPVSLQFVCYLLVAGSASSFKVTLPGIDGTLSVSFLFILLSILQFGWGETLLLGFATVVVQSYWHSAKRLRAIQVIFNMSQVTLSSSVAYVVYESLTTHVFHSPQPLSLAAAAVSYFLLNTAAMSVVISLTEDKPIRSVWVGSYFWSLPYYLGGAAVVEAVDFLSNKFGWQASLLALPVVYLIYRSLRLYLKTLQEEKQHAEEMSSLHLRTIEALALAIEAKDHHTHEHLQRVRVYALELAKALDLTQEEMEALRAASLLHDIGKLAIPESIIAKPGKLNPAEFAQMKTHPVIGAQILKQVRFPYPVVPIVRSHHEKWDGSGYPDGLKGDAIPIGARILAAVDCLDALASDRQYRRALPLPEAMARVEKEAGKSFDPAVVRILSEKYVALEKLARAGAPATPAKLATEIEVTRGIAPAAGFEHTGDEVANSHDHSVLPKIASALREAERLLDLRHQLPAVAHREEIFSLFAFRLHTLLRCDALAIFVNSDGTLRSEYVTGKYPRLLSLSVPAGEGLSGWVALHKQPILNGNPSVEPGFANDGVAPLRSALAIALEGVSGVSGVLSVYRTEADAFTTDEFRVLSALASTLGLILEQRMNRVKELKETHTWSVLKLPGMENLVAHLEETTRGDAQSYVELTVFSIRMDSTSGNPELNAASRYRVISLFSEALMNSTREGDYVAQMGNASFAVVVPEPSAVAVPRFLASMQSIEANLHKALQGGSFVLQVGMAACPEDGTRPEKLIEVAERALYRNSERQYPRHSLAKSAALST